MAKLRKTNEEYVKELREKNPEIIPLEEYRGNTKEILHKHIPCGYEWNVPPKRLLRGNGCPKCSGYLGKMPDEFARELHEKHGNDYEIITPYEKYNRKIKLQHKCGYVFDTLPGSILSATKGKGCPKCSKRHYYKKNGSLSDNYPDFCNYLVNKEDGKRYGRYTKEMLLLKCPDCGHIQRRQPNSVITHGFHCEICRDGISKNEKIMRSVLSQLNIDFEVEKIFDWSDKKRYDFYFDGILCETHGCQHYEEGFTIDGNTRTFEDEIANDKYKKQLAFKNGFNDDTYIVIDCRNSNIEWVKDNILSSKLSQYYDLSIIDWDKCELDSMTSIAIATNNLWNDGKSVQEIVKILKVSNSTVTKYLTRFHKLGMNSYDYNEERSKFKSRKVVCLNTKEIFKSITEASTLYNVDAGSISECCMKHRKSAGSCNNKKLVWAYYEDYISYSEDEIQKILDDEGGNSRKVICLNTGQIFKSIIEATKFYGFKSKSAISGCCNKRVKSAGKDETTGEKLRWMYYEEYLESISSSEEGAFLLDRKGGVA